MVSKRVCASVSIHEYVSNHLFSSDVLQKDSDDIDNFITWNGSLTQDEKPSIIKEDWQSPVNAGAQFDETATGYGSNVNISVLNLKYQR